MRSTEAPFPLKRPLRPSVRAIEASVPLMLLLPPFPPVLPFVVVVFILPVWKRILTRSRGATQVLAMAPAAPPAISSWDDGFGFEREKEGERKREREGDF